MADWKANALLIRRDEVDVLFEEPFCGVHSVPTDHVPSKEQGKIKELSAKLQTLSVRNINKQIKRRDTKLAEAQAQVKEIEKVKATQEKAINLKLNYVLPACQCTLFGKPFIDLRR